jgi:dTMP kinase
MGFEKKGLFFAIEGTDGSGKATQVEKLETALREEGLDVLHQEFPNYPDPASYVTRQYLGKKYGKLSHKKATLLYLVDRINSDMLEIKPHLVKPNAACVTDRWVGSNEGHQGGKAKSPEEFLDVLNFINWIEYEIGGLTKPDATFYLRQNPILGQRLSGIGKNQDFVGKDLHEGDINHLYDASAAYDKVAAIKNWNVVNLIKPGIDWNDRELFANASPAELMRSRADIHEEIWDVARTYLK